MSGDAEEVWFGREVKSCVENRRSRHPGTAQATSRCQYFYHTRYPKQPGTRSTFPFSLLLHFCLNHAGNDALGRNNGRSKVAMNAAQAQYVHMRTVIRPILKGFDSRAGTACASRMAKNIRCYLRSGAAKIRKDSHTGTVRQYRGPSAGAKRGFITITGFISIALLKPKCPQAELLIPRKNRFLSNSLLLSGGQCSHHVTIRPRCMYDNDATLSVSGSNSVSDMKQPYSALQPNQSV
nr:hypothetical protein CFP56_30764 [Quercus suber]